eukprot:1608825-Pyramimonas_sp.AAC.1
MDESRRTMKGMRLCYTGVVIDLNGDWMEFTSRYGLPSWSSATAPCFKCMCTQENWYKEPEEIVNGVNSHDEDFYDNEAIRHEVPRGAIGRRRRSRRMTTEGGQLRSETMTATTEQRRAMMAITSHVCCLTGVGDHHHDGPAHAGEACPENESCAEGQSPLQEYVGWRHLPEPDVRGEGAASRQQ